MPLRWLSALTRASLMNRHYQFCCPIAVTTREFRWSFNAEEKFEVKIDVQDFKRQDISVTTVDGFVVVQGRHTRTDEQGGCISRQFTRRYVLPEGYAGEFLESRLSSDGILIVTAPKKIMLIDDNERKIHIKEVGPVRKN